MSVIEKTALKLLRQCDPEFAHGLALRALRTPFAPSSGPVTSKRLRTQIAGIDVPNPVGLAAGFDKNAEVIAPLMRSGFGFLEVGAATPLAQPGNPKPRLFRLSEDQAAINRFGFNNDGVDLITERLSHKPKGIPVGLNLGANKDSPNRAEDFIKVLEIAQPHIDFATINVSSPNTEKLRDLQGPMALAALLDGVCNIRGTTPIFLKIAPDLSDQDIADVAKVATDARIDAIIATNTTLSRDNLKSRFASEKGGLSGQPLFEASTRVLARLATLTSIPLIGVGGVASGEQAFAKITAGASAVQLYTGLVYGGLSLASKIAQDLDVLLGQNGFDTVSQAVGSQKERWLS